MPSRRTNRHGMGQSSCGYSNGPMQPAVAGARSQHNVRKRRFRCFPVPWAAAAQAVPSDHRNRDSRKIVGRLTSSARHQLSPRRLHHRHQYRRRCRRQNTQSRGLFVDEKTATLSGAPQRAPIARSGIAPEPLEGSSQRGPAFGPHRAGSPPGLTQRAHREPFG